MTDLERAAYRERVDANNWRPRNAVWELTLACNLRCGHCGSHAGKARPSEMSLEECLDVADQLGDLGCDLITLSGGEPTLKKGWDVIARRIADRGMYVNMVTNGYYRDDTEARAIARRAKDAGMCNVGISIDGPQAIHDHIRGEGTFAKTVGAIGHFGAVGLKAAVMTTVNKLNFPYLRQIRQLAIDAGATMWRLQLGKPMGEMDTKRDIVIDPKQLLELMPLLADLKKDQAIRLAIGDSIGYYGPYDPLLRSWGWRGRKECWKGCQAGMQAIGIEADGGVKGCLSLQAKYDGKDPFVEGNLRENTLREIWYRPGAFAFNRDFDPAELTGGCKACEHATLCRGGARCVSSAALQSVTEDPYCWHHVAQEERRKQPAPMSQWAAAAGAAFVMTMTPACSTDDGSTNHSVSDVVDAGTTLDTGPSVDPGNMPEYGMEPDYGITPEPDVVEPDATTDYGVQPDYGVPPEDVVEPPDEGVQTDYGLPPEDAGNMPEYGVPPEDIVEPPADEGVQTDYGLPPEDAGAQPDYGVPPEDAGSAIVCEDVCCECEYGVIPDEVWEKCCKCKNVCCECDYGIPPEGCCD